MVTRSLAVPTALGIEVGDDARVDGGWLVRDVQVPEGLDGPDDVLQGGFAAGLGLLGARLVDRFGAPVTAITARLQAPTPLAVPLTLALRDGDGVAHHDVELRHDGSTLVRSSLELAGRDPAPVVSDLLELATVALPPRDPQPEFPRCFVCGAAPTHPHAQRCLPGWHGDAVVNPWVADEVLAGDDGTVDPLVVAAMLDCPGAWSGMRLARAHGWSLVLLGTYEVRFYRDVPVLEPLRLVARADGIEGRKVRVRSALVDEEQVTYAVANAVHIAVSGAPQER